MALHPEPSLNSIRNSEIGPRQAAVGQLFLRELERLWTDLLRVAAVVENALSHSVDIILDQRSELTNDVIDDERQIDRWEVRIEEKCLTILALHQPVASDLRRVAAVLKLNSLMERLSDLASHIAIRARKLNNADIAPDLPPEFEILARCSLEMLSESLDALAKGDSTKARNLLSGSRYATIERQRNLVRRQMKAAIRADIDSFDTALRLINIARNFKRVAEHSLDIAVETVYLMEGVILRHQAQHGSKNDDVD